MKSVKKNSFTRWNVSEMFLKSWNPTTKSEISTCSPKSLHVAWNPIVANRPGMAGTVPEWPGQSRKFGIAHGRVPDEAKKPEFSGQRFHLRKMSTSEFKPYLLSKFLDKLASLGSPLEALRCLSTRSRVHHAVRARAAVARYIHSLARVRWALQSSNRTFCQSFLIS